MTIQSLLLLILVACISLTIHADNPLGVQNFAKAIAYTAAIKGTCTEAIINGVDRTRECNPGLIFMAFKNGRGVYTFFIGTKSHLQSVAFGALRGEALTATQYAVSVDNLDVYPRLMAASGSCVMKGIVKMAATYTCEANSLEAGNPYRVKIVFNAEGAPQIFRPPTR